MSQTVALLSKLTYRVRIKLDIVFKSLSPKICLFDTGAGLIIINSKFIQKDWIFRIKSHLSPKLRCAIKEPITLHGTVILFIGIKQVSLKVWIEIVENLAVNNLRETPSIDRNIKSMSPEKRKVVPWHSSLVPFILKASTVQGQPLTYINSSKSTSPHDSTVARVAKQDTFKPFKNTCHRIIIHHKVILLENRLVRQQTHSSLCCTRDWEADAFLGLLIINSDLRIKSMHLAKDMIVVNCTVPLLLVVDIPQSERSSSPSGNTYF